TLGFAGHAEAILSLHPSIQYVGFDKDTFAIEKATERLAKYDDFRCYRQPFSTMFDAIETQGIKPTHILLDLGVSSYQIDSSERGFTFQNDEPLDMRMDTTQAKTAKLVLETYSQSCLMDLFRNEADMKNPSKLVDQIIAARTNRRIETTFDLINIIKSSVFVRSRSQLIAQITRIFQAIRVEVNGELNELDYFLEQILPLKNVTVAIITFQPNEDRRVKAFVKEHGLIRITKKPLQSTYHERKSNPREKTAKLRIFKV
ncbi:MAG: 16S rRNA (cytosine(1402)-N(4))-methyltransferase RsmH, partial [Candidatus Margulisiibacteriota bacterium]